jgi:hypothetical protein
LAANARVPSNFSKIISWPGSSTGGGGVLDPDAPPLDPDAPPLDPDAAPLVDELEPLVPVAPLALLAPVVL